MPPPLDEPSRPSRSLVLAVTVFVLAIGAGGYAWLGSREGWQVAPGGLAGQLQPDDADGWLRLARSYSAAGRFADAAPAWQRVLELKPNDAQAHADAADVIGLAAGGQSLEGEPERLLHKALQLDPDNVKALALAGRAAFDRGDAESAARHWQRALLRVEAGSDFARELQAAIMLVNASAAASSPAGAAASVQGRITLAPALRASVSPDDNVFVFARAVEGARAPLAVLRRKVSELPFTFTLDDSMAMSPALRLSSARQVMVGARISKSGNASPQAGDLQGLSAPVAVGARDVELEIAEVVR